MTPDIPPNHAAMDIGSITLIILSAIGIMPGVAALLAVIWYTILIYDRLTKGRK